MLGQNLKPNRSFKYSFICLISSHIKINQQVPTGSIGHIQQLKPTIRNQVSKEKKEKKGGQVLQVLMDLKVYCLIYHT